MAHDVPIVIPADLVERLESIAEAHQQTIEEFVLHELSRVAGGRFMYLGSGKAAQPGSPLPKPADKPCGG